MNTKPTAINIGGNWYNTSSIEEVVVEIQRKAHLVAAGLGEFTDVEKFAYQVIKDNTSYFDVEGNERICEKYDSCDRELASVAFVI